MYPYYQIAEPGEGQSVFTDCWMICDIPHPDTGKRYLLARQFPTLSACTRAFKELVPDAEYVVETFLPRKNSKRPQHLWHRIPKPDNGAA